jgi:hypothetical protein
MASSQIAEIQTGKAVLYGIRDNGTDFTISGYATIILQGVKPTHKFDLSETKDANNNDVSLQAVNERIEATLEFVPSGATRAAAAGVAVFLSPLSKVTTANFQVAALNGDWLYVGDQQMDFSNGAAAKVTLPVRKYVDATQNASLTTKITG